MVIAAAILFTASAARAQQLDRPATISGHPNFNGIWQALNTAYWNLEGHPVEGSGKDFWQLGAIAAIPAGKSLARRWRGFLGVRSLIVPGGLDDVLQMLRAFGPSKGLQVWL